MTDQLPPLPEPDIEGTAYDKNLKICYVAKVNFSEAKLREYGAACAGQSKRLLDALVALAAVAKVESDAEYRAVLDARDVIAEVIG